ncbi:MAG: carboxypeptidase regulatory-like domain-containing protein, partial [Planctomycetes bacterium]|nr:carboxypeptidase regulatory-like domain-containing protein [Planctomycetota bacterium]
RLQWFQGTEVEGAPIAEQTIRSDAAGRFEWRGPAPTDFVTVRALPTIAMVNARCTPVLVEPGQREVELEVSLLVFDRVLFGQVRNANGEPIANAELSINRFPAATTHSGIDGRYELPVFGPPYPLLVFAAGYQRFYERSYIADGVMRQEFDVELVPGPAIRGRVADESGAPLAAVTVRAANSFATETDARGEFVLWGARHGENHLIVVSKPGYQRTEARFDRGREEPLDIVMPRSLVVTVRAVTADGTPVPGAGVSLRTDRPGLRRAGITGLDGSCRLDQLSANKVVLFVERRGLVTAKVPIDPATIRGELLVTLIPGRTLSGRVVDGRGEPIAGATVYCEVPDDNGIGRRQIGNGIDSDADGRFRIGDVPPEPCRVRAWHHDYTPAAIEDISGSPEDLVLRMTTAPCVTGRAIDGQTRKPLGAFTVLAPEGSTLAHRIEPRQFADCDGYWRVDYPRFEAGTAVELEIRAAGYAPQRFTARPAIDPPRDQHGIELFAGTTVAGIVSDAGSGAPLAGVEIAIGDPRQLSSGLIRGTASGGDPKRAFSAADGRFELRSVPAGSHRLLLRHPDYPAHAFGPFEVLAGSGRLELQPTLSKG